MHPVPTCTLSSFAYTTVSPSQAHLALATFRSGPTGRALVHGCNTTTIAATTLQTHVFSSRGQVHHQTWWYQISHTGKYESSAVLLRGQRRVEYFIRGTHQGMASLYFYITGGRLAASRDSTKQVSLARTLAPATRRPPWCVPGTHPDRRHEGEQTWCGVRLALAHPRRPTDARRISTRCTAPCGVPLSSFHALTRGRGLQNVWL